MHEGTGAGVIFGATGGVMEAALRSAYYIIKGENPPAEAFTAVRSQGFNENDGVQEANFQINDITVRTAVVSGLGNTRELIRKIESGVVHYDFVEVMACPGGCVGGGGQRSTTAKSAHLNVERTCIIWIVMRTLDFLMRIQISFRCTKSTLKHRCLTKLTCFCILTIRKMRRKNA